MTREMKPKAKTKRKKRCSPSAMAMKELRAAGYHAAVVEQKIPYTFISRDFMNWADIIYLTESNIVGLQVTTNTGGQHTKHRAKILAEPRALAWIKAGGLIELWSFAKQGPRGKVKKWVCRKEEITEDDFGGSA